MPLWGPKSMETQGAKVHRAQQACLRHVFAWRSLELFRGYRKDSIEYVWATWPDGAKLRYQMPLLGIFGQGLGRPPPANAPKGIADKGGQATAPPPKQYQTVHSNPEQTQSCNRCSNQLHTEPNQRNTVHKSCDYPRTIQNGSSTGQHSSTRSRRAVLGPQRPWMVPMGLLPAAMAAAGVAAAGLTGLAWPSAQWVPVRRCGRRAPCQAALRASGTFTGGLLRWSRHC